MFLKIYKFMKHCAVLLHTHVYMFDHRCNKQNEKRSDKFISHCSIQGIVKPGLKL
jgi:hypothetical protein